MKDKIIEDYKNTISRLQQECTEKTNAIIALGEQLKAKEQECEELKKELMQKSEVDMFFNTPIEGWSNDPCGICRYKQTLTEIKFLARELLKRTGQVVPYEIKQIIQKISEAENDKSN